jgi:uncharacterized protein (TIGR02246 family)
MNKANKVFAQLAAAAIVLCAGLPAAGAQSAANPDEELVRAAIRTFETGWNRHDMDAMFKAFAPDAEWVNIGGMWWQGLGNVKRAHQAYHETFFAKTSFNIEAMHVRLVTRDTAVAVVKWNKGSFTPPDGQLRPAGRDIMTIVLVRKAGGWQIAAGHNTTIDEAIQQYNPVK